MTPSRISLDWFRSTLVLALSAGLGCTGKTSDDTTPGTTDVTDADTDTDTDSDTDTDTDSDTDVDVHSATGAHSSTASHSSAPTGGCVGGTPILDSRGVASGLVTCPDGSVNRSTQETCDPTPPAYPACSLAGGVCEVDADCVAQPNGKCFDNVGYGRGACGCVYPCSTDADCGGGQVCVCGGALTGATGDDYSHCAPAGCAVDADCGPGECGVAQTTIGVGCPITEVFACRTGSDLCRQEADCSAYDFCTPDAGGTWECTSPPPLACGRPMEVEGALRLAPPAARPDWQEPAPGYPSAVLAAWWSRIGAMEHASVASFNRVALELLQLGAPPELVAGCQQAALDEVRHARICWGLAAAHGATDAGPGPLDLSGFTLRTERRELLEALISEACVNETLSAAEVRAGATAATTPHLRDQLGSIATDEESHAALAWRTLGWMSSTSDEAERTFVATCFERAFAHALAAPVPDLHAPEHGIVGGVELAALRQAVVDRVLRPAAARLG